MEKYYCNTCADCCGGICECRISTEYQECLEEDHVACELYHEEVSE